MRRIIAITAIALAIVLPVYYALKLFPSLMHKPLLYCNYAPLNASCSRARLYYELIVDITVSGLFLSFLIILAFETGLHRLTNR